MSDTAVFAEDLGKCFRFYPNKWNKIFGAILHRRNGAREVWAVNNVSFAVPRGDSLAIIGANGAGKTTLLQLLAGLLKPTQGKAAVHGNLATLLELGGGFQPELTGRENIFISAGLRGFSKREIEHRLEPIIEFSELENFIDHPVRHYSSGMLMRLAFATAINVQPDVLLIDEVFAVGDMAFQYKCVQKFRELQKNGATILLVTHDMTAAKSLCNHGLLLDQGRQVKFGSSEDVANVYLNLVAEKIEAQKASAREQAASDPVAGEGISDRAHRHGTGDGRVSKIEILPSDQVPFGAETTFRFYLDYYSDIPDSGLGFYIRDRYGNDILGINTFEEGKALGVRKKGDRLIVDFRLSLYLRPGTYSVSPGFSYHREELRYLDWIDNAAFFSMEPPLSGQTVHGFVYVPNHVSIQTVKT